MLYALINNEKTEASETGLLGTCPICKTQVFSRCGTERVWHWAHKGKNCDSWHETETEWHKAWKSYFSPEDVEVVIKKNDVLHRADILTNSGICIEIQNSPISAKVIGEREDFYRKIIWIVNAEKFKHSLSYSFCKEIEQCQNWLPELRSEYKPVGFKSFPAFIFDASLNSAPVNEIVRQFAFEKETYTGTRYKMLLGMSELEVMQLQKEIISCIHNHINNSFIPGEIEDIALCWPGIPKAWDEALAPILFDIGDDKLVYMNGNPDVSREFALVSKQAFLGNPDSFNTDDVESCYGDDSWMS